MAGITRQSFITSLGLILLLIVFLAYSFSSNEEVQRSKLEEREGIQENHEHFQRHASSSNETLDYESFKDDLSKPTEVETKPKSPLTIRHLYTQGHTVSHAELCPYQGSNLKVFVFITSAADHFKERQSIRQTWGHYRMRSDTEMAFMIGETDDAETNSVISEEDKIYGDVIRGKFHDTYYNLTLKTVSMLEWLGTYCSEVDFVLKTDDDMFINMGNLYKFIDLKKDEKRVIFGKVYIKGKPYRDSQSKYYLSKEEFSPPTFPKFATGPAYLMSSDCVNLLYGAALDEKTFKLEDIFFTGILAEKLNIRRVDDAKFFNTDLKRDCRVKDKISVVGENKQFQLWSVTFNPDAAC